MTETNAQAHYWQMRHSSRVVNRPTNSCVGFYRGLDWLDIPLCQMGATKIGERRRFGVSSLLPHWTYCNQPMKQALVLALIDVTHGGGRWEVSEYAQAVLTGKPEAVIGFS